MIYKTLHWYILRELLRIFLMTATALTTLLAFGGTFRPLTKEGLEIGQLLLVLTNLMPAMLAYAIPMAALFAAVLVYWRMSTDNEITACRAGGVSFRAIVFPALALGLTVASADLVFVNYVVPLFLRRTEAAMTQDLASLLVHNIGRQEPFQSDSLGDFSESGEQRRLVVYADSGAQQAVDKNQPLEEGVDERTVVQLNGVAAAMVDQLGKPTALVVARAANVIIDEMHHREEVHIRVQLVDGAGFDPNTFRRVAGSGSVKSLPANGKPFVITSIIKNRPKFMDLFQLRDINRMPASFGDSAKIVGEATEAWREQKISERLIQQWRPGQPMTFDLGGDERVIIDAPAADLDPERQLVFSRSGAIPVKISIIRRSAEALRYTCDSTIFNLSEGEYTVDNGYGDVQATLQLSGNVLKEDLQRRIRPIPAEKDFAINGLWLPKELMADLPPFSLDQLREHPQGFTTHIQTLGQNLKAEIAKLVRTIGSELHSRGSFALSCLTLVLLGAALGILMRGRNPLLVFVIGFVPAIILVLLITAGRRMIENTNTGNVVPGFAVIWAGNLLLLGLVALVYGKLLRQ